MKFTKKTIWTAAGAILLLAVGSFLAVLALRGPGEAPDDEAARQYDRAGQVGDPPASWKDDYAHWDSADMRIPLEQVGMYMQTDDPARTGAYSEEEERRRTRIFDAIIYYLREGALSYEPKENYVLVRQDERAPIYAAPEYADLYRSLAAELQAIDARLRPHIMFTGSGSLQTRVGFNYDGGIKVVYYRRPEDGALLRDVTLPNGERQVFTAGPAPDMSRFDAAEALGLKAAWSTFAERGLEEERADRGER